jgi:hypothetical protein
MTLEERQACTRSSESLISEGSRCPICIVGELQWRRVSGIGKKMFVCTDVGKGWNTDYPTREVTQNGYCGIALDPDEDWTLEERIGKAFSDSLREALTDDEWNRMKRDNARGAWASCASHDYVDANEYMDDAIRLFKGQDWYDKNGAPAEGGCTDEFAKLWNRSWDIAQDRWLS